MRGCQDGFYLWGFESELLSFDLAFATSPASWTDVNTTLNTSWAVEAQSLPFWGGRLAFLSLGVSGAGTGVSKVGWLWARSRLCPQAH